MQAVVIGLLMVLAFFAINSAVYAAAPFIAIGVVGAAFWFFVSKDNHGPPDLR